MSFQDTGKKGHSQQSRWTCLAPRVTSATDTHCTCNVCDQLAALHSNHLFYISRGGKGRHKVNKWMLRACLQVTMSLGSSGVFFPLIWCVSLQGSRVLFWSSVSAHTIMADPKIAPWALSTDVQRFNRGVCAKLPDKIPSLPQLTSDMACPAGCEDLFWPCRSTWSHHTLLCFHPFALVPKKQREA